MSIRVNNARSLYLEGIRDGKAREAVTTYTGDRYIQHSTGVADGVEGFVAFFEPFVERNPKREIEIVRAIEDENNVFLHAYQKITSKDGSISQWVTTDFFAYDEHDKIVEHWDVISEYCTRTPSGHTSTDGQTDVRDHDATEVNKVIVRNLITDILMPNGDSSKLDQYISSKSYIQHNKNVEDGIDAFRALAQQTNNPLQYKRIALLVGQGNFVATLCEAMWEGKPYAQVDLFRLDGGKVVEHWDNVEPVPEGPQPNSGKF